MMKAAKTAATAASSGSVRSCPGGKPYLVQDGDTCDSIAGNHSVSTYGIVRASGNLDPGCKLLKPGKTICLPERTCATHKVYYGDTCWTLGRKYGATEQQVIDWNANQPEMHKHREVEALLPVRRSAWERCNTNYFINEKGAHHQGVEEPHAFQVYRIQWDLNDFFVNFLRGFNYKLR